MVFVYAVEFSHMMLSLIPKILNAIDMISLAGKAFGMIDTVVPELRYIKHIVTPERIRIDDGIWRHLKTKGQNSGCLS